jgi:hypothetical protein
MGRADGSGPLDEPRGARTARAAPSPTRSPKDSACASWLTTTPAPSPGTYPQPGQRQHDLSRSHRIPFPSQNRTPMPAAVPVPAPRVDPLRHPLHALTTFELRAYRRQLENAIAFFDARHPVPPARDDLQAKLDDVLAEQDDRAKLAARA